MLTLIRFASKEDAGLIADLSRQTFYDAYASQNTPENMDKSLNEKFSKEALMQGVIDIGNVFLLAFVNEEPAGYARMKEGEVPPGFENKSSIEIARIYAVQHLIGKGIGSALMQKCIDIAGEMNKEVIWLGVWEQNQQAIDFYTRWGFKKFARHEFILGNDIQKDWLMMRTV